MVIKESLIITLIHHLANLGLLVPLFVTGRSEIKEFLPPVKSFGKTVYGKHLANINTGASIFGKEEEEAVSLLTTLVWLMTLSSTLPPFLTLTIIYQKYFHPWRRILTFEGRGFFQREYLDESNFE